MAKWKSKTVPITYPELLPKSRPVNESYAIREVEGAAPPELESLRDSHVSELVRLGDEGLDRSTYVCLYRGDRCVATARMLLDSTALQGASAQLGTSSGILSDVSVARDVEESSVLPLLVYLALRRARIHGLTNVVTYTSGGPIEDLLKLRPVSFPARSGYRAVGQRLDIAMHAAYDACAKQGIAVNPETFTNELVETIERWLEVLHQSKWVRAIYDRTLTREQYIYSLENTHTYVRWTTRILGRTVGLAHDQELRDHFIEHLRGEINHEKIIERDLEVLGVDVNYVLNKMVPNVGTLHFMAVQESMIGFYHDPIFLMASPLAAEGISAHLEPSFIEALRDCVKSYGIEKPEQATQFWSSHINTDGGELGHWMTTVEMAKKYLVNEEIASRFLAICRGSMAGLLQSWNGFIDEMDVWNAG